MKSSDAQLEQLTAYLDGELNEHEQREVEALVARDPDAATLLESLRRVADSVSALPREAAPLNLSAAVQERMARQSLLGRSKGSREDLPRLVIWTNRLAIAACLGLVCSAGWLGLQSRVAHGPALVLKEADRPRSAPGLVVRTKPSNETLVLNDSPARPSMTPAGGWTDAPSATPLEGVVAQKDPGEVERQLILSGVSNDELQQADLSSFSNQLVIETDDGETHDAIVKLVADFAEDKRIPNANACRLPEPVQAQQAFYFVSHTQNKRARAPGTEETWIGVNAPVKATDELMARVEKVRSMKKAPMQVEVNGCNMESPKQASQILAMNTMRNQKMLNRSADFRQAGAALPAPSVAAPPASVKSGNLLDDDAGHSERESPPSKQASKADPSESSGYGVAKKDETKSGIELKDAEAGAKAEAVPDADDETKRAKEFIGGVGGLSKTQPRGAVANNEPASTVARVGSSAAAKGGKTAPPPPAALAAPADECVTLSICVRSSVAQRGRVGSATATQASDTLRQPAATSRPQTSMPASRSTP